MCEEPHAVKTAITEDGFTVEFAIPLSFGKGAGDKVAEHFLIHHPVGVDDGA